MSVRTPTPPADFDEGSVDLVKTYDKFKQRHGKARVSLPDFAVPIVRMADSTLGGPGAQPRELPGIRRCLLHLTLRVSWLDYLGVIPLPFRNRPFIPGAFGDYSETETATASLLVDSLMLTVTEYREGLRSYNTNLASILFFDILEGFERLCDWVERGVPISPGKNELIVPLDVARLKSVLRV